MSTIGEALMALIELWKEMFLAFWEVLPKMISVFLWVLSAIIILPCVFIANNLYPKWVQWGEDF